MDEIDLEVFRYGGVNFTGFRLIDPSGSKLELLMKDWNRLNPSFWPGAGPGSVVKVSLHKPTTRLSFKFCFIDDRSLTRESSLY